MKGIVFTEFLDLVESRFSLQVVDRIVDGADLPSGGAYTAVGTYPHGEMVALVSALSRETGLTVAQLLHVYGEHLFTRFVALYPAFFEDVPGALEFLFEIETRIHTEVRKLYPDAELPSFECVRESPDRLVMDYRSSRHMADFAHGLIDGCLAHFGEQAQVERTPLADGSGGTRFLLTRHG